MTEVNSRTLVRLKNIAEISERCSLEELASKSDTYLLRIPGFGKGSLRILRGMFPDIKGREPIDDALECAVLSIEHDPNEKVGDNDAD